MRLRVASTPWLRLRGLLFRPEDWLAEDEALVLVPCDSIHTLGMRYPIDVAFVSKRGEVLCEAKSLPPGKHLSCKGAVAVLERPSRPDGSAWNKDPAARAKMHDFPGWHIVLDII